MSGSDQVDSVAPSPVEPDAVGRGWIEQVDATREQVLFMLAGSSLGVGDILGGSLPEWFDLGDTTNLDAVGDPVGGMQPVEMTFVGGRLLRAGWPVAFCDRVVDSLMATLATADDQAAAPQAPAAPGGPGVASSDSARIAPAPTSGDLGAGSPSAPAPMPPADAPLGAAGPPSSAASLPGGHDQEAAPPVVAASAALPTPAAPAPTTPAATEPAPMAPAAAPPSAAPGPSPSVDIAAAAPGSAPDLSAPDLSAPDAAAQSAADQSGTGQSGAALVLEDVTYLGGYPGQAKRRKRCTATLTIQAVEVAGPNGLAFRVPWEVVRTIEAQNADEARFRMNTKVHRDATALVLECDQDVTVLLEARDCPTIPLRGAIAQLVGDLPVVVV